MRAFPGPLGLAPVPTESVLGARPLAVLGTAWQGSGCCSLSVCSFCRDDTHKVDVINFAQNKATKCLQNENLIDKESASLLWSFIVLLCRQSESCLPPRASLLVALVQGSLATQEGQAGFLGQAFPSRGVPQEARSAAWLGVKGGSSLPHVGFHPACAVCRVAPSEEQLCARK